MCRPVRCKTCGKTTWAGCGQHVDQVRRTVPHDQWCAGHADEPREPGRVSEGLRAWVRRARS